MVSTFLVYWVIPTWVGEPLSSLEEALESLLRHRGPCYRADIAVAAR